MGRKRYTAEQIIGMLREAEVLQSQGMTIGEISHQLDKASFARRTHQTLLRFSFFNDYDYQTQTA